MTVHSRAPVREVKGVSWANEWDQPLGAPVENWRPASRPDGHVLCGRFCTLEQLSVGRHGRDLYTANSADKDGRMWTYLAHGPFVGYSDYEAWLAAAAAGRDPFFTTKIQGSGLGLTISAHIIADHRGLIEVES